ncbi:MAG: ABC transporter permease [Actinomycetota bacterium]
MIGRLMVADLKILFRNRQSIFWALAFPIIFATVFGLFNFDQLPKADIAVYAEDADSAAPVLAGLASVDALQLDLEPGPLDETLQDLKKGDPEMVLEISRAGLVTLHLNAAAVDTNRIYVPVVRSVVDEVNFRLAGVERAYTVEEARIDGREVDYYDFVLPGLVGMGIMMYAIIGLAGTIAQYRTKGILRRIRATPLDPKTFVAGIVLAHLVLAVLQALIIMAFGVFAFGGVMRGNPLYLLIFVILGNLAFLNIGFMISTRVETAEAASGLGNAVSLPMMFFSGVFFPTNTLPWILPALTALLPLKPMVDGIRRVAIDSASLTDLGPELALVAAWALGTALIAMRVFRFERV